MFQNWSTSVTSISGLVTKDFLWIWLAVLYYNPLNVGHFVCLAFCTCDQVLRHFDSIWREVFRCIWLAQWGQHPYKFEFHFLSLCTSNFINYILSATGWTYKIEFFYLWKFCFLSCDFRINITPLGSRVKWIALAVP